MAKFCLSILHRLQRPKALNIFQNSEKLVHKISWLLTFQSEYKFVGLLRDFRGIKRFCETEDVLPRLMEPSTGSYSELVECWVHSHISFP
jgi:hypothetical protein